MCDTVVLQFARTSLMYDIANYAYIEGHKLEIDEGSPVRPHLLYDITAEGNVERVNRVLAVVYGLTKLLLHKVVVRTDIDNAYINSPVAPAVYEITIIRHPWMDDGFLKLLTHLIHEFMVCQVIYDWLSITHPDYGKPWLEKADTAAASVHMLLRAGLHSHRRTLPVM